MLREQQQTNIVQRRVSISPSLGCRGVCEMCGREHDNNSGKPQTMGETGETLFSVDDLSEFHSFTSFS